MKPLVLCALAALLAVPAQAQLRVGADLGTTTGDTRYGNGPAASLYASAEWGALRARLGVLDASVERLTFGDYARNADGTYALNEDGEIVIENPVGGTRTRLASTLTVGLAVPVYRGAGVGFDVGARVPVALVATGGARGRRVSEGGWLPVFAPEIFVPGPRGSRLHLRAETLPWPARSQSGEQTGPALYRLNGGVSVPLRF